MSESRAAEGSVLLDHRRRVHIGIRSAVRLWQLSAPSTVRGRAPVTRLLAGTAADIAVDISLRSPRRPNWARLIIDTIEAAGWAMAAPDTADGSRPVLMPSMSLALESGVRDGPGGLLVPAVVGATAVAVRARRGHALRATQIGWPAAAAIGGWTLSRYESSRREEVHCELDQHRSARTAAAFRAGQLEVAAHADSLIDEVQRACVLVEDDGGPTVRSAVGAWKSSLAESVRAEAAFLSDALLQWQTLHNLHADLRTAIRFELEEGRLVVLSKGQCHELWTILDHLPINGAVEVTVSDPNAVAPAGSVRRLDVGGHAVTIAEDLTAPRHVDVLPPQLLMGAALLSMQTPRDLGAVRPPVAFSGAAAYVATAVWAHRTLPRTGRQGRAGVAGAILGASAIYTVVATCSALETTTSSGLPQFPVQGANEASVAILASVYSSLTPVQRRAAVAGCLATFFAGWLLSPQRAEWRYLVSGSVWSLAYGIIAGGLTSAIDESVEALAVESRREEQVAVELGLERGRQWVRDYASTIVDAVYARFAECGATMPPAQRAEAERRLAALSGRLAATAESDTAESDTAVRA